MKTAANGAMQGGRCPWWWKLGVVALLLAVAFLLLWQLLLPRPTPRTEIFHGVYLTVEQHHRGLFSSSHTMIVEVHLDTPGVSISPRPFSFPIDSQDDTAPHYRLFPADLGLLLRRPAVFANATSYQPSEWSQLYPGKPVRSLETLIRDGIVSHLHEHSYMILRTRDGTLQLLHEKPPLLPDNVEWGIGVQGIGISDGRILQSTDDSIDTVMDRNFLGIDPARGVLWLIATTATDGHHTLRKAQEAGVRYGGRTDSGDGTHLLIGYGAKGILPHTGIRNARLLGPWLELRADPIRQ